MGKRSATTNPSISDDAPGGGTRRILRPRLDPPTKRLRQTKSNQPSVRSPRINPLARKRPTELSLPPEIWRLIGEKLPYTQVLRSLVSVSRTFQEIFTPLLYQRRTINLEYFLNPLETPLPPYLEYVQDFRINLSEFGYADVDYEEDRNREFSVWITRALESMRSLRSFSWIDQSYEEYYTTALIIRDPHLLHALKSTQTLRKICIQFAANFIEDYDTVDRCAIPLRGFRNLTSLELYGFYGDYDELVKDIAYVLCDSPSLRKLGLGLASECAEDFETINYDGLGREPDFLKRLCDFYGSKCKQGPLELETLRLGWGMYLGSDSLEKATSFTKLTSVKSLKVLHLFNGSVMSEDLDFSFYPTIDWSPFTANEGVSLRQLSVTRLEEDITNWLRHDGSCVQELIVTDHYSVRDKGLDEFFNLPPGLSLLHTREKHPEFDDGEWSDTDSEIYTPVTGSSMSVLLSSGASDSPSPQRDRSRTIYLNSKGSKVDKSTLTVLDRLPDGGSHLTRLSMSLEFETQWSNFSSHLVNFTRLTQLHLSARSYRGGNYPTLASSLWPEARESSEIARRYVHLICPMCPTLRYIKIGHDLAWEVLKPRADHIGNRTRSKSSTCLRQLDKRETLQIELFSMTEFAEQTGLPGPVRDREENFGRKGSSPDDAQARLTRASLQPLPF